MRHAPQLGVMRSGKSCLVVAALIAGLVSGQVIANEMARIKRI